MDLEIVIREAGIKDLESIYVLIYKFVKELYKKNSMVPPVPKNLANMGSMIAQWVANKNMGSVVVAEDIDGKIVGFSATGDWGVKVQYDCGKVAHDLGIYVLPEYRDQKLAGQMLELERKLLVEREFNGLFCGVQHDNIEAIAAVTSAGYEPYQQWFYRRL